MHPIVPLARPLASTFCRIALAWALCTPAFAQSLSLGEAALIAADGTPGATADAATMDLGQARSAAARASLLPSVGISGGVTVGTGNVVAGGLFAPPGYPALSGPPTDATLAPGWAAQGGATARWDLLGLVGRIRQVDAALAGEERDAAAVDARRLERTVAAGFAWIAVAEAEAAREVALGDMERARQVLASAEALVASGVRPGVERALAAADVALATQRLARAEGEVGVARARLAAALGGADGDRALAEPPAPPASGSGAGPPAVVAAEAELRSAGATLGAARAAFLPRLELLAASWYRAGVIAPGAELAAAPNWAGGIVLDVPLLDLAGRSATSRAARASRDMATARLEQARVDAAGQEAEAAALLDAALRAGESSDAVVGAATDARRQAEARYAAGLVDVTIVAATLAREREARLAALSAQFDVLRAAITRDYARGDLSAWLETAP